MAITDRREVDVNYPRHRKVLSLNMIMSRKWALFMMKISGGKDNIIEPEELLKGHPAHYKKMEQQ